MRPDRSYHVEAIPVGQSEIENDEVGVRRSGLDRCLACLGGLDMKTAPPEIRSHRAQDRGLVVDDEHARPLGGHDCTASAAAGSGTTSGSVKRKTAPPLGRFAAEMRPPWASTR